MVEDVVFRQHGGKNAGQRSFFFLGQSSANTAQATANQGAQHKSIVNLLLSCFSCEGSLYSPPNASWVSSIWSKMRKAQEQQLLLPAPLQQLGRMPGLPLPPQFNPLHPHEVLRG